MTRKKTAPQGQRQLRIGEEVRHALAAIIAEDRLDDPELRGKALTVTQVRLSPDLTNASVFVVPLWGQADPEAAARLIEALNRAAGYFRGRLSHRVKLRLSPRLRFMLDQSFQEAGRIERLLRDPMVARDLESFEGEDGN